VSEPEQEQLELVPPAWVCPLYGCRNGCTCSPEKQAETRRRQQEREQSPEADRTRRRSAKRAGPSNRIPFRPT
jgi:hypothetical protein